MTSSNLARAGVLISGAFFASRVLGWVRMSVITAVFGPGPELDAFFAAFRIPDLIFQLVAAGAIGSALIPVASALIAGGDAGRAWRVVSIVANLMLIALAAISVAFALAAPVIVPLITPGFDPAQTALTVDLTRIMTLGPAFLALGAVATSVLNSSGRFSAAALAPIVYNLAIIAAALLLGPSFGVTALAIGVVLGSVGHLLVQVPAIRRRTTFVYDAVVDVGDAQARRVFALLAPRALGMGASQITFIVNTTLASTLGAGAITALTVAFTIVQLPLGLIAVPLGVVLLPTMSRAVASGERDRLASLVDRSVRVLAYTMLFVTAVAIVTRHETVILLFDYGRFDDEALAATADTLLVFLFGLTAHALIAVLARSFYAAQDTRTPVAAALVSVAVNVAISLATFQTLGLPGLALGIAVGAWVEVAILLARLTRRLPELEPAGIVRAMTAHAAAAVVAGGAAWVVLGASRTVVGPTVAKPLVAVEVVAAVLAGGLAYAAVSRLLRFAELDAVVAVARASVARGAR